MRIGILGGTGTAGRATAAALGRLGHEVVVLSRARGVDALSGKGLDDALSGVHAVVDAGNVMQTGSADDMQRAFVTATRNLLQAEERAGVKHHVLLSIIGIDRTPGNAHYAAKRAQEQALLNSPVPVSVLRVSQFFEFAHMVLSWTRQGDVARLPPLLLQPIAASEVGEALAELAVGVPQGRVTDLAGPEPLDLIDMVRRITSARGDKLRIVPSWRTPLGGPEAVGESMLAGPDARLGKITFEQWLSAQSA
jgi:uncharacterized protein YbjT (DUF2867 family)